MQFSEQINMLKNCVRQMIAERHSLKDKIQTASPSPLWMDCLKILHYVINLSADDFRNIRYHAGIFTGKPVFQYAHNHPADPLKEAEKLGYPFLVEGIDQRYWMSEPEIPTLPMRLGFDYKGKTINSTITRSQFVLSNLFTTRIGPDFLEKLDHCMILEIGPGYGPVAHALKQTLKNPSTYILMDFPEMLLFAGGYLMTNNPQAKIYVYSPQTCTDQFLREGIKDYDFVLLPNYITNRLYELPVINFALNMISFQEMSKEQIDEYSDLLWTKLQGYLYSQNSQGNPANKILAPYTVSQLLSRKFNLYPSTDVYEKQIKVSSPFWCRNYFATPKGKGIPMPGGTMRYIDAGKYYTFTSNNNSKNQHSAITDNMNNSNSNQLNQIQEGEYVLQK